MGELRDFVAEVLERRGAAVEAMNSVLGVAACGEHEDTHRRSLLSDGVTHGEAVDLRQIDVEDDRIVRVDAGLVERILSVHSHVHRVGLLPKTALEGFGERNVILYKKESHDARR